MTSKERILAVLARQPVDRIPVDIWHTGEVFQALADYTGLHDEKDIYRQLGLDKIIWFGPTYKGPVRPAGNEEETTNCWGIRFRAVQAGQAEYSEFLENPLASYETPESLEEYPWWPDPEQFDLDAMVRDAERGGEEFATMGPWVSFFEIYCWMRGLENAMMDVVLNPVLVDAALDRIEAIQTEMLHRFLSRAKDKVSLVFISDDMGGQNGLLISLKMWKQFIEPRLKRWCRLVHSYGVKVFYHSDGSIEPLIPHLIEAGIDVLNPIQHVCPGMEMPLLKQKYGDRLIFHGGVDNQSVLPFGTPAQVRAETEACIEALGPDGFICCSCHNVQAGTPIENILAMIQTVAISQEMG
jgi:uroporphyrinogen decarboxylase